MRVTLQRKGKVKSFETILTMESFTSDRIDIAELLQHVHEHGGVAKEEIFALIMGEQVPASILSGMIRHLKSRDLLNPNGTISTRGKRVVETGLVPVEERGQFIVHYIEDAILKNHLLHYERSSDRGRRQAEKTEFMDSTLFKNRLFKSIIHSSEFKIKQFDGQSHLSLVDEDSGTYQLFWEIDLSREEQSLFAMSGELKSGTRKPSRYTRQEVEGIDFDVKKLLYLLIDKVKKPEMVWNPSTECLEVPLDDLPAKDYETLLTSLKLPVFKLGSMGEFEPTEIYNIPIGPRNASDAKKWSILLARKFLEEGYKNNIELIAFLQEVRERKAFLNYRHVIDALTAEAVIESLKAGSHVRPYWNLQAPMDLFMDVDDRYIVHNRRVDVTPGQQLSMAEMVKEIAAFDNPEVLVFSSKYVRNPAQIKKFELFVNAFKAIGVRDVFLVTKDSPGLNKEQIKVESYDDVYAGSTQPHDRYFAYKSNGTWHRFKMTAELDQCRYMNWRTADEHTRGTWEDISFLEILPEIFPERLNERLHLIEEVHYL
ncbi:hypothetical protein [Mesobacillus harenae]|uniref:hypothetical protein n=1 Tax=Mesobacillus harenae TaxID=2213203 RepID=UPI00158090B8|nr:hypothetical protein [Mesobacillus harenae]